MPRRIDKPRVYTPSKQDLEQLANKFIKKNNLEVLPGNNGKMYARMPDGRMKSLESIARDYLARTSKK